MVLDYFYRFIFKTVIARPFRVEAIQFAFSYTGLLRSTKVLLAMTALLFLDSYGEPQ